MTLSALNAPESDIDIEGDSSSSKKLEFDSGRKDKSACLNYSTALVFGL